MKRFMCLASLAFCAFLGSCDQAALMRLWTSPEAESLAMRYVELLRQGKFDQIERNLDPSLQDSNFSNTLTNMASVFPQGAPSSIKVVGSNIFKGQEYSTTNITLEYQFPSKWILVNVATKKVGDVSTVVGFHVYQRSDSLENLDRFTFVGKGAAQYSILILAICSVLFSIYVFILCIRTRVGKRKWLWALFILAGVGSLAVNWTTGEWTVTLLWIQIPAGTVQHPLYGPWTVAVHLPLGALLFLNHRKKKKFTSQLFEPPEERAEASAINS